MERPLSAIIRGFIASEKKQSKTLAGGLALAYTPPAENDGFHRLTISRFRVTPSTTEQRVIRDTIRPLVHVRFRIVSSRWKTDTHYCVTYNWPDPKYQPVLPLEVN